MTETLASPLARALGFALLQFLWQGALIGAGTAVVLIALRRRTADARYAVACAGLTAMIVIPVVTGIGYLREAPSAIGRGTGIAASPTTTNTVPAAAAPVASSANDARGATNPGALIERWLPVVVVTWSAGVLLLALHLLRGWLRLRRIRRHARPLDTGPWLETVRWTAARLGVTRPVRLVESALVEVPAVIGALRPVILVPASALTGLSPAYLEAILAHELAHVRRGDYIVNILQCVVEVLLFYHPAVWWVSGQIRIERENCCDDLAASLCADRVTYARALASLEELRGRTPALAMAADGAGLLNRVRRLVDPGSASGPRWSGGFMTCAVLTILLLAASGQITSMPAAQTAATPPPRDAVTQTNHGSISGDVRDQSGGVIPGATVTVSSPDNPGTRTSTTNSAGRFQIPDLAAGTYDVTVSLQMFKTFKSRVQVGPNEILSGTIRLQLGAMVDMLEVRARPPVSAPPRDQSLPVAPPPARPPAGVVPMESPFTVGPLPPATGPIRVGGNVREPKRTKYVEPAYPSTGLNARVEGYVIIEAVIGKDGTIKDARILKSHSMFDDAAVGAVRQWVYRPAELSGVPTEVVTYVTVVFKLMQ